MNNPKSTNDNLQLRARELQQWFVALLPSLNTGSLLGDLHVVSGDASFRRYFRAVTTHKCWILVDAPPAQENSKQFVEIARHMAHGGVHVPIVIAADLTLGFMCLSDFGDTSLWSKLAAAQQSVSAQPSADSLYGAAFEELLKIQLCATSTAHLPLYDKTLLLREMRLFSEWFCTGIMRRTLSASENSMLENVFQFLVEAVMTQTQVFVHRDYHSRNLMYREAQALGVLDFQDAVCGPVTYDLVSLLKDCYIVWPRSQVTAWAMKYAELAQQRGIIPAVNEQQFLRDFDLMGLQRHIKVAGIFGRLWLRDGKPGYLKDIPLTLRYISEVVPEHAELSEFSDWIRAQILPNLDAALVRATQDKPAGALV
jgi:aminoglycoside/choline kinase family phosphotransferase